VEVVGMKRYLRSYDGLATGSITVHRDGSATLIVFVAGKRHKSEHKNERAAKAAWYRWSA
jgi:hypothetical protein